MRDGEHNGEVRCEERYTLTTEEVIQAIKVDRDSFPGFRLPKCYLYNDNTQSYIRIPYHLLCWHLSESVPSSYARYYLNIERTIHGLIPRTIYVR